MILKVVLPSRTLLGRDDDDEVDCFASPFPFDEFALALTDSG